jgi:hypothetical protein
MNLEKQNIQHEDNQFLGVRQLFSPGNIKYATFAVVPRIIHFRRWLATSEGANKCDGKAVAAVKRRISLKTAAR